MIKKRCKKCQNEFRLNAKNFYYKDKNRNTFQPYCKRCWNNMIVEKFRKKKEVLVEVMGGKCFDCGYNKCMAALKPHHLDPKDKEIGLSRAISRYGIKKMLHESKKCVLLCSNCHRERHWKDGRAV